MDISHTFDFTFKELLESYLASIDDTKIFTLQDLIQFNKTHADQELPPHADNQNGLLRALQCSLTSDQYHKILQFARKTCGAQGIDKTLEENNVDIIIGPGMSRMYHIACAAGYPVGTLPLGYLDFNGSPFGLQVLAKAHQEPLIVQAQSAWEATFSSRQPPSLDEICSV